MAFGKEIKRLREQENISVSKLASIIGVSADRLRKWEEKDFDPREEDTLVIEHFFRMPISYVMKLDSIKSFLIVQKDGERPKITFNTIIKEVELMGELLKSKDETIAALRREVDALLVIIDLYKRFANGGFTPVENVKLEQELIEKLESDIKDGVVSKIIKFKDGHYELIKGDSDPK